VESGHAAADELFNSNLLCYQDHSVAYYAMLCCLFCSACYATLYAMLCYAMLCYATLYAMLCYAMLEYGAPGPARPEARAERLRARRAGGGTA
jgi:hypothetical protein